MIAIILAQIYTLKNGAILLYSIVKIKIEGKTQKVSNSRRARSVMRMSLARILMR